MNTVILIGNTGRDPEIRTMRNGSRVANFSLATSESWRDRTTGERRTRTEWHKIVVFNQNLIGLIDKAVKKGSKLSVQGQVETRKWTNQAGQDQYSTEIVLKPLKGALQLLDRRAASAETHPLPAPASAATDLDFDEIPF